MLFSFWPHALPYLLLTALLEFQVVLLAQQRKKCRFINRISSWLWLRVKLTRDLDHDQYRQMDHIEVSEQEKDSVYSWLRDYNYQHNGDLMRSLEKEGAEVPVFLSARDADGKVIGGVEGKLIHQWLKIQIMAVDPEQRSKGVGKELMLRAEQIAVDHGCRFSYVDTMCYQAPDFYTALGYLEVGRVPNWDSHGHDKIFYTKRLEGG